MPINTFFGIYKLKKESFWTKFIFGEIWFLGINYIIKDLFSVSRSFFALILVYLGISIWGVILNTDSVSSSDTPFSISLHSYYFISWASSISGVFGMTLAMKGKMSSFFWYFISCITFTITSYATGYMGDAQYAALTVISTIVAFYFWKRDYNMSFDHIKIKTISWGWKIGIIAIILILLIPFYFEINWLDNLFKPFVDANGNYLPEKQSFWRIATDTFNTTASFVSEFIYILMWPEQYIIYFICNIIEVLKYTVVWSTFAGNIPININEVITWTIAIYIAWVGIVNWYNIFGFNEKWIKFKKKYAYFSSNFYQTISKPVIVFNNGLLTKKSSSIKKIATNSQEFNNNKQIDNVHYFSYNYKQKVKRDLVVFGYITLNVIFAFAIFYAYLYNSFAHKEWLITLILLTAFFDWNIFSATITKGISKMYYSLNIFYLLVLLEISFVINIGTDNISSGMIIFSIILLVSYLVGWIGLCLTKKSHLPK